MAKFSPTSAARLATCDERLQRVFNEAIKHWDITILCGQRGQAEQEQAFKDGASTKHWPDSNHNTEPSQAVDASPYPIDWNDQHRWRYFAGLIIGLAAGMGIKLRSGVDWDGDLDLNEHKLKDAPHFEIAE